MLKNRIVKFTVAVFLMIPFIAIAQTADFKEHRVVKGDTLWDISKRELNDPFLWPGVWKKNPDIKNPDRIYPDQIIRLPLDLPGVKQSAEKEVNASSRASQQDAALGRREAGEEAILSTNASRPKGSVSGKRFSNLKGIILYGGESIEGEILGMTSETVVIRTTGGTVRSYSFIEDVETFIRKTGIRDFLE